MHSKIQNSSAGGRDLKLYKWGILNDHLTYIKSSQDVNFTMYKGIFNSKGLAHMERDIA